MKDPICGMEVAEPPRIQTILNGKIYGFCNPGCLAKFKADPGKYSNSNLNEKEMDAGPKAFLPLLVVFAVILLFSLAAEFYQGAWQPLRFMENFMAAFFIVFGGLKLGNWKGFAAAYQTYDVLAKKSRIYSYAYPLLELGLGAAYFLKWNLFLTNLITVTMMSISSIGVAQTLRKNQKIQCACLGVLFKIPMTKVTLLENILMGLMAGVMLFFH